MEFKFHYIIEMIETSSFSWMLLLVWEARVFKYLSDRNEKFDDLMVVIGFQLMQESLEAGAELMPDRQHTLEEPECQPPKQGTPIRKNSRNRGRETRKVACDEDVDDEAEDEDVPIRRPTKRNRTLIDQFR